MRVGLKDVGDAVINLGHLGKGNKNYSDKDYILKVIEANNLAAAREISEYYYKTSGMYKRVCDYFAFLYRYDWFVTPFVQSKKDESKLLNDFSKVLNYLDNSDIKKVCGRACLHAVKTGSYYGLLLDLGDRFVLQQLPSSYCRNRYNQGNLPIIELDLSFFDKYFSNPQYKLKVLQMFPKDIQQAYVKYKEGQLKGDFQGDYTKWYMIDAGLGVRLSLNDSDFPPFFDIIPSIIDLDKAQDLDQKKMLQQLLKILIQKLPLDKNNDLVFDMEESKDIHQNAVAMLRRAVGVDVLTTFADVQVENMSDTNSTMKNDDLQRVERTVYNNAGISQNLFNATGNVALEKSTLKDEAMMRDFLYQIQFVVNYIIQKKFNRPNHYAFKVEFLETTIYNYKELAKMYKDQVQLGYSKLLPQIALGQSQSTILATLTFENNILNLSDIMVPPRSSTQMSSSASSGEGGRPSLDDSQKSDKTLANEAALG